MHGRGLLWMFVHARKCVFPLRKQTDIMKCVISHDGLGLLIKMQTTRAPELKQAILDFL